MSHERMFKDELLYLLRLLNTNSAWAGVSLTLIGHAAVSMVFVVQGQPQSAILLLAVYQWLYVLPLLLVVLVKKRWRTAFGIWATAAVTMLPMLALISCFRMLTNWFE